MYTEITGDFHLGNSSMQPTSKSSLSFKVLYTECGTQW